MENSYERESTKILDLIVAQVDLKAEDYLKSQCHRFTIRRDWSTACETGLPFDLKQQ